jgi:outer membrane lipoprotein-sorting protein
VARTWQARRARWLVPVAVVAAVGVAIVGRPIVAGAAPSLPDRSPAQLLAAVASAGTQPFSGTIVETASLGLPSLPQLSSGGSSTSLTSLIAGSHTARVWYDGPDQVRFALLGSLAETDVVRNNNDLWVWDSQRNVVQHLNLPDDAKSGIGAASPVASALPTTPADAATEALAAVDPTTRVSVDGTASVAGRAAYALILQPRDTRSLVSEVRIAVDAKTSIPLRVQVFAKNVASPAFETGFTSVSIGRPAAAEFTFTTPPGATVSRGSSDGVPTGPAKDAARDAPTVVGDGWTAVLVLHNVSIDQALGVGAGNRILLKGLTPVQGSYGTGRVLQTRLLSLLALDDGRLLVGAVPPSILEEAAAAPEAAKP